MRASRRRCASISTGSSTTPISATRSSSGARPTRRASRCRSPRSRSTSGRPIRPSCRCSSGARCKSVGPTAAADDGRVYLDDFRPYRECMIWDFNRLFWQHLGEWEAASGRGFEAALPSGTVRREPSRRRRRFGHRVLDSCCKELEDRGPAAGRNLRARDRRRLRRARRGVDRRLQGARRAAGHRLLLASCSSSSATTRATTLERARDGARRVTPATSARRRSTRSTRSRRCRRTASR